MPAKGKHRRPKANPITRGFVVAGTGGAAIALPLMGATGAHAAGNTAPVAAAAASTTVSSASSASSVAGSAAVAPVAAKKATPTAYTVVTGDYLSKIAADHRVQGGWQKLYADNRQIVGDDPAMIHPGLKLTLGAKSKATAPAPSKTPAPSKAAPKPKPKPESASKASTTSNESGDSAAGPAQSSGSDFIAPVSAGVTTPYRASGAMWSSGYHTGVDFAASSGTSVKAVGQGTVVSAGWSGSYGNEVVIKHGDGNYSQYAHLSSLSVSAGESVRVGQQIGLSGTTGNSSGPHLHFEIRTGPSYGSDVDPLAYLRQHGVSI
jgi:murein DD-endopeptidase MepM/ murein hydrolase activator NlpD